MVKFVEDRDVLIKADFSSGVWTWVRGSAGDFDLPIEKGRFYGFGLSLAAQADLYSWFQAGAKTFCAGTLDWKTFERKGRELAAHLAILSLQRFNVYYQRSSQNSALGSSRLRHVPWKHKRNVPVALTIPCRQGSMWEGKITLCFGHAEDGWVQMVILSTAFNNHHIIRLSEAFDPFPGLVAWIVGITRNESSNLVIDEEGNNSYLTARTIDENWLELIVEADHYRRDLKTDFPARSILAIVNRRAFVGEFYRRFTDFLEHEYSQRGWWYGFHPELYTEDQIARTIELLPPNLDLGPIRGYLAMSE